jgi:hypothetical protein
VVMESTVFPVNNHVGKLFLCQWQAYRIKGNREVQKIKHSQIGDEGAE